MASGQALPVCKRVGTAQQQSESSMSTHLQALEAARVAVPDGPLHAAHKQALLVAQRGEAQGAEDAVQVL